MTPSLSFSRPWTVLLAVSLVARKDIGPSWHSLESYLGESLKGDLTNERWPSRNQTNGGATAPVKGRALAADASHDQTLMPFASEK